MSESQEQPPEVGVEGDISVSAVPAAQPAALGPAPDEPVIAIAPVKPRRRLVMTLLAGVTVLTVLAGGGAFAALKLWSGGGGALPEDVVPASIAAFVRVNLNPGISQRVKFEALLKKFPAPAKTDHGGGRRFDDLKRTIFEQFGAPISYDEVKPWFDDRFGVGLWADAKQHPVLLLALAYNDDAKARQVLIKAREKAGADALGFVIADGYAIVASAEHESQANAEAAAQAAQRGSLAGNTHFRAAAGALPADQALLGWADLAQSGRLLGAMAAVRDFEPGLEPGLEPDSPMPVGALPGLDALKGFVVTGAKAVDNGIEIRSRGVGMNQPAGDAADVRSQLDAMPGNSAVAAVLAGSLGELAFMAPLGGGIALHGPVLPPGGGLEPSQVPGFDPGVPPGFDPSVPPGFDPSLPPGFDPGEQPGFGPQDDLPEGFVPPTPDEIKEMEKAWRAAEGLSAALTGAKLVGFALSGIGEGSGPLTMLTLQLGDNAAAEKLLGDLAALVHSGEISATQQGDRVEVRSKGYVGDDGKLGDKALYTEAMAGGPTPPTGALYLDVRKLADAAAASADTTQQLGPVRAVGFTISRSGNDMVAVGRIIIH